MNITNGIISEIVERMGNAFITVEYGQGEAVRLLVDEGTTITGQNFSTVTRFHVPEEARILNRKGRPMDFSDLMLGMRAQVRHANFMTASIPPQTTAYEVRVL